MIREACIDDEQQIYKLGKELNSNFDKLYELKNILNNDFNKIYVFELNGKVIGFVHLIIEYENVEIINILIDSKYRKQGFAKKLLKYAFSVLPSEVKNVFLEVSTNNLDAINLYKKFDLKIVNLRLRYYSNGDDAYIMKGELQ